MRKLLKESDIRQMMKLANIPALSDGFINKLNETSIYEQEEEEFGPPEEEGPPEDLEVPGDLEAPGDLEVPEEEGPSEELGGEEDLEGGGVTVEDGLEGLDAFLKAAIAHPDEVREKVQVEMTGEEGAEELGGEEDLGMMPPEGEEDLDMPPEGEEDLGAAMDMGDEEEPGEELEEAQIEVVEDDNLVNEVMRRVARRLLKR